MIATSRRMVVCHRHIVVVLSWDGRRRRRTKINQRPDPSTTAVPLAPVFLGINQKSRNDGSSTGELRYSRVPVLI